MTFLKETSQSSRVREYLQWAESREEDVWLRDDIRIAWITVLYAERGYLRPFVAATYQVLGIHPDKLSAALEARRRQILGPLYDNFVLNLPPKKPSAQALPQMQHGQRKVSGD